MRIHAKSASRTSEATRKLRTTLAEYEYPISQSKCQETLARILGFKSWHEMRVSKSTPSLLDHQITADELNARRSYQAKQLSDILEIPVDVASAIIARCQPSGDSSRNRFKPGIPGAPNPWPLREDNEIIKILMNFPREVEREEKDPLYDRDASLVFEMIAGMSLSTAEKTGTDIDYENAAAVLHEASSQGACGARYNLANLLSKGTGIARNESAAIRLFELTIKDLEGNTFPAGHVTEHIHRQALVNLGSIYQYGEQVPRDLELALSYYRRAKIEGEPVAGHNVAIMNIHRWGCNETNYDEVFEGFELSSTMFEDDKKHLHQLKSALREGKDNFIFEIMNIAGGMEDWARCIVIDYLLRPESKFYDPEEGIALGARCLPENMPKSAEHAAALLTLHGDAEGRQLALQIHKKLAESQDLISKINLAGSLLKNDGSVEKTQEALDLLTNAISSIAPGHTHWGRANYCAGMIFLGRHGEAYRNNPAAIDAMTAAILAGIPEGGYEIGMLFWRGAKKVPKNVYRAAKAFEQGANLGSFNCKRNLGLLHLYENFRGADIDIGIEFLKEAEEHGDQIAAKVLRAYKSAFG